MPNPLGTSQATSLGLHSLVLMAAEPGKPLSAKRIAYVLRASEAHLAKVLQRLARDGLVRSTRGPKGGFALNRPPHKISLLDIYKSLEGDFRPRDCLFETPICRRRGCILGGLLKRINTEVREYLEGTKLSELTEAYGGAHARG